MTYDQWKTRDPNDTAFYDVPEDDGPTELDLVCERLAKATAEIEHLRARIERAAASTTDPVVARDLLDAIKRAPQPFPKETASE